MSELGKEKKIFVVDSQRLNELQKCMRSYQYKFGKSFEPLDTPIQFEKGSLLHHGLEFYYRARQIRDQWAMLQLQHSDIIAQAIDSMRAFAVEQSIEIEDVEDIIRTYREYVEYNYNDGWDNVVAVEQSGSKILYEDSSQIFVYEFKIDLIVALNNYPALPVDHKSFSRLMQSSDMNNQFKGYCWALGVNNLVINKIGLYAESSKKRPNEKFIRETLSYSQPRLDEWQQNAIFWIRQGIAYIENDLWPMNETSCDKWSGCSFRSVCQKNPEDREEQLERLFQIRTSKWDVGSKLENSHKE